MGLRQARAVLALFVFVLAIAARTAAAQGPTATLTPLVAVTAAKPGDTVRLALHVRLPEGFHLQSDRPRDQTSIPTVLWLDPADGLIVREIVFPPSKDFRVEGYPEPLAVFEGDVTVGAEVVIPRSAPAGPLRVAGRFRYQACNDKECLRPRTLEAVWTIPIQAAGGATDPRHAALFDAIAFGTGSPPDPKATPPPLTPVRPGSTLMDAATKPLHARLDAFTVLGATGGYQNVADFRQFISDAEAGVQQKGMFADRGPLAILAIVFLGGLALNLTPCVLPMIPINLAIIGAGAKEGRRRRGFLLGATYGGAMAIAYGLLGLIVILTAGTFGTINSSPWFNLALMVLFVALALAMFDVLNVDLSRWSSGIKFRENSQGTFLLAFGMGAVAALLAGACVAPVVIQVVVFASDLHAKGTSIALALPFVLGLGMALPWPLAGAGMANLPKPGAWMVRVKQLMGVFILGTAVYYGYLAYELFSNRWVDPATVRASAEEQLKSGWYSSLEDGLAVAARDKTPVLIDFWATWCKNCLVMDRTTLADDSVKSALAGYTKIKFQAEDQDIEPAASLIRRFGIVGLPAYVILRPRE